MNDENTPRGIDHIARLIVFRLDFYNFSEVSQEASYADSRTLHGLGCPPRTISYSEFPREEPAALETRPIMVVSIV